MSDTDVPDNPPPQGAAQDDVAPTTQVLEAPGAEVLEAPTTVAAPETEAEPEAVVHAAMEVLTAMGLNPSATDGPAPAAPPTLAALAALQWTRREAETVATAEAPTFESTTTSLAVDPAASSAATAADSTASLQAQFDALRPGDTLTLAPGTYNYSDNLYIRTSNVSVVGNGTTLNSTNPDRAAVVIQADNVSLRNVNLTAPLGLPRADGTDQTRLVFGGTGVRISDVSITGGASAGVYITGAIDFRLDRVTVQNTAADGIQITNGSNNGVLTDVTTRNTGDDAIAIVSYQTPDLGTVRDITVNNPVVQGSGQRGLVVVGGERITFNNINVSDTALQAVFVGSQAAFAIKSTDAVRVNGGIVTRGGRGGLPFGAVVVYNDNPNATVTNVTIENLTLVDTPPSAYGNVGIISQGGALDNISFRNIAIRQPFPSYPLPFIAIGAMPGTYSATGFTVNGVPVDVTPVGVAV